MSFALLCFSFLTFAQSLRVEAPNLVATGENFNVSFVIEGEHKPSDFSWSQGNDFQLVWGPQQGSSTSISIINGKRSTSVKYTYTYILSISTPGKYTLPAASATVKGNTIHSKAVEIEVVSNGASSSNSSSQSSGASHSSSSGSATSDPYSIGDSDLFMSLILSKNNVVVGEPITATIKLYQRVDIAGLEEPRFPSFNGFWNQDITPQGDIQFVRENVNDRIYNSAVIRKYTLIPQSSGKLTIEPAELLCRVYVRTKSSGTSIFDSFFDDGYTTVRKRVSTRQQVVNVSPLPANAPADFGGGVGRFNISAKLSRDSLITHEAASLLITVSGQGNISLLEAPKVNFPPDFELYDTKIKDNIDKSTGGINGSKTYEYPFIPRSAGDFVIEPVSYSYYDINTRKYLTLKTDAISLNVKAGKDVPASESGVAPTIVSRRGVKNLGEDIRYISVKKPDFTQKANFFVGSALFWFVLAAVVLLAVIMFFAMKRVAAMKADVAGARKRGATKMALRRLRNAESYLKQNIYSAFYEELHKALMGFVSDKLNIAASELSKENISQRFKDAAVPAEMVDKLIEIIDACEYARYAPSSSHDAMDAHFNDAANVISGIESTMKNNRKSVSSKAGRGSAYMILLLLSFTVLSNVSVGAQQKDYPDSLWNSAVQAYADSKWEEAAQSWMSIASLGLESPELYCNIGNAYFKADNNAKAILWYERALKLDPSFESAVHNLEIASSLCQDDIDSIPEFFVKTWLRKMSYTMNSNAWAWVFIAFFALSLAMLVTFLLSHGRILKPCAFFASIAAVALAFAALAFSLQQRAVNLNADSAVVMYPVAAVKSSPSADSSKDLFVLHSGTRLRILDNVGDWTNIELSDGRQGWIQSKLIEII